MPLLEKQGLTPSSSEWCEDSAQEERQAIRTTSRSSGWGNLLYLEPRVENSMPTGGFKNNVKFVEASLERVTREKESEKQTAEKSRLSIVDGSWGRQGCAHALDCAHSVATTQSRGDHL